MGGKAKSTHLSQRTIGRYRATVCIATGSMGTIWKAQSRDRSATVAVKLMSPDTLQREGRGAFEREFRLCRDFDHPNLLHYHELGEFEGLPYLVMEYFPGQSLKSALAADETARPTRGKAREILAGAAAALDAIHGLGLLHRDVKPDNLLVDGEGGVKLIDFSAALSGWSRWIPLGRKASGTPSYMAPEQIRNALRLGPPADLYALACVIFEFFAGRPPFTGEDQNAILQQHLRSPAPRLSRFCPDVSPALDKLVAQLLAKNPKERLPDAEAFLCRFAKTELFRA